VSPYKIIDLDVPFPDESNSKIALLSFTPSVDLTDSVVLPVEATCIVLVDEIIGDTEDSPNEALPPVSIVRAVDVALSSIPVEVKLPIVIAFVVVAPLSVTESSVSTD